MRHAFPPADPASLTALQDEVDLLQQQLARTEFHEKQLELVIRSTGVGIWDWHIPSGQVQFNERWANMLGYTLAELAPCSINTWLQLAHPDDLPESNRQLQRHWNGETDYYLCETRMRHKNGYWVWVYDTGQLIERDAEGKPLRMIGTHLDISQNKRLLAELQEANQRLTELSYHDALTGIANRRALVERLQAECQAARRSGMPLSLLMIDVDYFKPYNDHYGHLSGDAVLVQLARVIAEALPRQTDLVARFGGEELVALLPYTDARGANVVAEQILQLVRDQHIRHDFSSVAPTLTVSIGIASGEVQPDVLLDHADRALYAAKHAGRNCCRHYPG